jgi:hypothetical protein
VESYGRDWRVRFACWITKATDTHSEYVILFPFHDSNGYSNGPLYNVIRTLCVVLTLTRAYAAGLEKRQN